MRCFRELYETYELNQAIAGVPQAADGHKRAAVLVPINHTQVSAGIEVSVTPDGCFHSASLIENKEDRATIIPITEASAGRSGLKIAPHPLHDTLMYVAGDLGDYGISVKRPKGSASHYELYMRGLSAWASAPGVPHDVVSIRDYLAKGCLIHDLVTAGVLYADAGELINTWSDAVSALFPDGKPPLFSSVVVQDVIHLLVRFRVMSPQAVTIPFWRDPLKMQAYTDYITAYSVNAPQDLCYITGREQMLMANHPKGIRRPGDGAKLISSNDSSGHIGMVFYGRFVTPSEAVTISADASQKVHNALRWLIRRQGVFVGERVFLLWATGGDSVFSPDQAFDYDDWDDEDSPFVAFTGQNYAQQVARLIKGYRTPIDTNQSVNVLVLNAATPGRLSIVYERTLDSVQYADQLKTWQTTCFWERRVRDHEKKQSHAVVYTPSIYELSLALCGERASDSELGMVRTQLLSSVVDGQAVPFDLVTRLVHRASRPDAFKSSELWKWANLLSQTCALVNRRHFERTGEVFYVGLNENETDRNYLFGRMLAIADVLEYRAMQAKNSDNGKRASNALRYMDAFANHPMRTWRTIQLQLVPYVDSLGGKGVYLTKLIDNIALQFHAGDFNDRALNGLFLLGFYSQRATLYAKKSETPVLESSMTALGE